MEYVMESEDNLNDYINLKNIEGKVLIKKNSKHDDFEEDKGESIDENPMPIENNTEDETLEFCNLDVVTASIEQESLIENENKCDRKTESDEGTENKRKGILKYQRTYSNKHVDFNMDLEFVPFDESKDYTIEIQIVEQMPKKIVSYAALFAQQKKEEEKLMKEAEKKEKQNRKHSKKRKYREWKKNRMQGKQNNTPIQEIEHNSSQVAENDFLENHLSTEDEMDDEKDDFSENSYHSDTDKEEHSDATISTECESIMYVEDNISTNRSEEQEPECKNTTDDLNKHLNDTETEAEMKQADHNEAMDNNNENSRIVEVINESYENSIISQNNADNLQFFCVPAKKQRSNSLSDLDDFRKSHRFVVQRLPREIELIISRELEKQYYQ